MANLMVVQGSGRKRGFTTSLMYDVMEEIQKVDGLEVEVYHHHLPVHVARLNAARMDAIALGFRLAEAALADERNGRRKLSDE